MSQALVELLDGQSGSALLADGRLFGGFTMKADGSPSSSFQCCSFQRGDGSMVLLGLPGNQSVTLAPDQLKRVTLPALLVPKESALGQLTTRETYEMAKVADVGEGRLLLNEPDLIVVWVGAFAKKFVVFPAAPLDGSGTAESSALKEMSFGYGGYLVCFANGAAKVTQSDAPPVQ